jgi:hypothetical protein
MTEGHNEVGKPSGGPHRHSGMLVAGIQKSSLDAGLRRYDERTFMGMG